MLTLGHISGGDVASAAFEPTGCFCVWSWPTVKAGLQGSRGARASPPSSPRGKVGNDHSTEWKGLAAVDLGDRVRLKVVIYGH